MTTYESKDGKERERDRDKDGGGKSTLPPDELTAVGRRGTAGNTHTFAALEDTVRVRSNSDSTTSEPDRNNEVRYKKKEDREKVRNK